MGDVVLVSAKAVSALPFTGVFLHESEIAPNAKTAAHEMPIILFVHVFILKTSGAPLHAIAAVRSFIDMNAESILV